MYTIYVRQVKPPSTQFIGQRFKPTCIFLHHCKELLHKTDAATLQHSSKILVCICYFLSTSKKLRMHYSGTGKTRIFLPVLSFHFA